MFKLDLEKAEEPRPNCQHPLDHRKQENSRKSIYFCFIDYTKAFDCVHHHKVWKILKVMGIFIGRTDTEAPVLWLSDTKSRVIGKDPDVGENLKRKEEHFSR